MIATQIQFSPLLNNNQIILSKLCLAFLKGAITCLGVSIAFLSFNMNQLESTCVFPTNLTFYVTLFVFSTGGPLKSCTSLPKVVKQLTQLFQHRGTHWWAAPLYQKQRNRSGLNNWLDCLASWYTSNFNLCIQLKAKWQSVFSSFHHFSRPTVTGIWEGIQWVPTYCCTCTCVGIHPGRVEPASPIALTTSRTEAL